LIYVRKDEFAKIQFYFLINGRSYYCYYRKMVFGGQLHIENYCDKKVIKKLKKYNDSKKASGKTLRGLDAYYKYGLKGVFGTFVLIKSKKSY
jgi:hypothetical protein